MQVRRPLSSSSPSPPALSCPLALRTPRAHPSCCILSAPRGPTEPRDTLIQATDGNFYGTTFEGGAGSGTVFKMTPAGIVSVLHVFTGGATDGGRPATKLIQATDGNFYGTTTEGGAQTTGVLSLLAAARCSR